MITRGGAALWYEGLAARSCDIFDLMSGDEYRRDNETRWKTAHGSQKQQRMSEVDERVLGLAARQLAVGTHATLHPKTMYKTLNLYWTGVLGLQWYESFTRFAPMRAPVTDIRRQLPDDYYVVKFYFRPSFPDTAENRGFVAAWLRTLSRIKPVVVLTTGVQLDDHVECDAAVNDARVITLNLSDRAATNLAVQSEVIAGSSGFFGTYGGLCYLPMYYNVPAWGFVSDEDQVLPLHQTAALHASSVLRREYGYSRARLRVLHTDDAAAFAHEAR